MAARISSQWVTIPVGRDHFRKLGDPQGEPINTYYAYVGIRHLPSSLSLETDPRQPNPKSSVARAIGESLLEGPQQFHLLNRGITITAEEVEYDNRTEQLRLRMPRVEEHGILDGGHTYRVIEDAKQEHANASPPPEFLSAFVKVEILTGVEGAMLTDLAEARNTSAQVKPFAIDNLADRFEWIKDVLNKTDFGDLVGYKENEDKPISVVEVITYMTLFHPKFQGPSDGRGLDHPVVAYTSKQKCLDMYRQEFSDSNKPSSDGYLKLQPVLLDILKLVDAIHLQAGEHLRKLGGVSKILTGRSGLAAEERVKGAKLTRTKELGGSRKLYFLGGEVENSWPNGLLFPMVSALRAVLNTRDARARWETDPQKFFAEHGPSMVVVTFEKSSELARNPNAVGKSRNHWEQLFTLARLRYLESISR